MLNNHRPTEDSERQFAEWSQQTITDYWRARGFYIKVWVEPKIIQKGVHTNRNAHFRTPIFPISSNIGPHGYPPRQVSWQR